MLTANFSTATPLSGGDDYRSGRSATSFEKIGAVVPSRTPESFVKTGGDVSAFNFEPSRRAKLARGLDAANLARMTELLDDIENSSAEEQSLALESLRCTACVLWLSAKDASQYHQSILALIEGMLLSCDDLNANQAACLRGAVKDLASKSLNENYVDVLRSRFVDEGYNPLAILSSMEADVATDEHSQS